MMTPLTYILQPIMEDAMSCEDTIDLHENEFQNLQLGEGTEVQNA